ncbi:MAG: hypothetical protein R3F55_09880 [Alphaproteobacteria bacterium]
MTMIIRLTAIGIATALAASQTALATDPNGSAAGGPRIAAPGPATIPTPGRNPAPTDLGAHIQLPPAVPGDLRADDDATVDDAIGILLGADDLRYPHDVCYGLIACCNTAWVQGCEFAQFDIDCVAAGGWVEVELFSDGSHQYSCHAI